MRKSSNIRSGEDNVQKLLAGGHHRYVLPLGLHFGGVGEGIPWGGKVEAEIGGRLDLG